MIWAVGRQVSGFLASMFRLRTSNATLRAGGFLDFGMSSRVINDSILGLESDNPSNDSKAHLVKLPCNALKGVMKKGDTWEKPIDYRNYWHKMRHLMRHWFGKGKKPEEVLPIDVLKDETHEIEQLFQNRMRFNGRCTTPWLGELHIQRVTRLELIANRL